MMNALTVQTFAPMSGVSHDVRVVTIDGEPWSVAVDVCRALGMSTANGVYKWITNVGNDERKVVTKAEHSQIFCGSQAHSITLISESGLYKLIMRSTVPMAKDPPTCEVCGRSLR